MLCFLLVLINLCFNSSYANPLVIKRGQNEKGEKIFFIYEKERNSGLQNRVHSVEEDIILDLDDQEMIFFLGRLLVQFQPHTFFIQSIGHAHLSLFFDIRMPFVKKLHVNNLHDFKNYDEFLKKIPNMFPNLVSLEYYLGSPTHREFPPFLGMDFLNFSKVPLRSLKVPMPDCFASAFISSPYNYLKGIDDLREFKENLEVLVIPQGANVSDKASMDEFLKMKNLKRLKIDASFRNELLRVLSTNLNHSLTHLDLKDTHSLDYNDVLYLVSNLENLQAFSFPVYPRMSPGCGSRIAHRFDNPLVFFKELMETIRQLQYKNKTNLSYLKFSTPYFSNDSEGKNQQYHFHCIVEAIRRCGIQVDCEEYNSTKPLRIIL